MARRTTPQGELFSTAPPTSDPRAAGAGAQPPMEAEKQAVRARQEGKCAVCGGRTRGGIALDVVRRNGVLVGLCRRHRLR